MKPPSNSNPRSLSLAAAEQIDTVCLLSEQSWKAGQKEGER